MLCYEHIIVPCHAMFVCAVCVYSVVNKTLDSQKKDSMFTTGRTVQYLNAVNTVDRSARVIDISARPTVMKISVHNMCVRVIIIIIIIRE